MATREEDFLYGDDLDVVLSLIEEDLLQEAPDFDQEIVDNISELPTVEDKRSFKCNYCPKIYVTKRGCFFVFFSICLDVPHLTNEHRTQDCIAS